MYWIKRIFNLSRFGTIKAIWPVIVLVIGCSILLIGIALIVLPGPAFVVIPVGLTILATEFAWARHWLKKPVASRAASFPSRSGKNNTRKSRAPCAESPKNAQSLLYANSDSGLIKLSWRRTTTRYLEHWSPPARLWSHRPSARMRSFSKDRVHVSLNFSPFCESCAISCADFAPCTSSVHV